MRTGLFILVFLGFLCEGNTARIKLFSGKVYHGSILSKGERYTIQTQRGIYAFSEQKIQSIQAGRNEWIAMGEYVELRDEPSFSSEKILRVFQGTTLAQAGGEENGFRPVRVYGRKGYVHGQFLVKSYEKPAQINPQIRLVTSRGPILIELFEDEVPNTTANFVKLAQEKFYQGLSFHRVDKDFLVMAGDPEGTGEGGPGYMIPSEISKNLKNIRGAVGMGDSGKDTAGSQFYILLADAPHLDGRYTVFGKVLDGLEILPIIALGDEIKDVEVVQKRDHTYKPEMIPLTP